MSTPTDDEVYIGEHRLSPKRPTREEIIDKLYDSKHTSVQVSHDSSSPYGTLPPRRVVVGSKYLLSPYDVNVCSYEPTEQETQYFNAIVRLATMDEYKK